MSQRQTKLFLLTVYGVGILLMCMGGIGIVWATYALEDSEYCIPFTTTRVAPFASFSIGGVTAAIAVALLNLVSTVKK